jgi:hypothetical protein
MKATNLNNQEIFSITLKTEKIFSGCGVVAPSRSEEKTYEKKGVESKALWQIIVAIEQGLEMDWALNALTGLNMVNNSRKGGMIASNTLIVRCKHFMSDRMGTYTLEQIQYTNETKIKTSYEKDENPIIKEVKPFQPDIEKPWVEGEEGEA